jgi:cell division protein ZapA (FtsZ GTPase activity inhibitor)
MNAMDDKNLLKIRIDIAGKSYHLRINRKDEELTRKAAREIDLAIKRYQRTYPKSATEKDWIAMVALQLSIENLHLEEFIENIRQMTDKPLDEYEYSDDKK